MYDKNWTDRWNSAARNEILISVYLLLSFLSDPVTILGENGEQCLICSLDRVMGRAPGGEERVPWLRMTSSFPAKQEITKRRRPNADSGQSSCHSHRRGTRRRPNPYLTQRNLAQNTVSI